MINEYIISNWDKTIIKKVYCSNEKAAFEKAKFLFPKSWTMIDSIKKGRTFKNLDDFIENR
jgi:hypothetical protein